MLWFPCVKVRVLRAWDSLLAEIRARLPQRNKSQRVLWNRIVNDVFPRDREVVVAAVTCFKLERFTIRPKEDSFTFNLMLTEFQQQFPSPLPKAMFHLWNVLVLDCLCPSSIETHESRTTIGFHSLPITFTKFADVCFLQAAVQAEQEPAFPQKSRLSAPTRKVLMGFLELRNSKLLTCRACAAT